MAGTKRSIAYLESKFQTGDVPTQQDFYDLFASFSVKREAVAIVPGAPDTLTLNMQDAEQTKFIAAAAISADFTLAITNASTFEVATLDLNCSAEIDITMPGSPDTLMPAGSGGGWTGGVLTLPIGTHSISIVFDGTYYRMTLIEGYVS
jgi:hypothetical protein